jgi:hypothetical protein
LDYIGPETEQWRWRDVFWLHGDYEGGQPPARRARVRQHRGQYSPLEEMCAVGRALDVRG